MEKQKKLAFVAAVFVAIIWGFSFLSIKAAVGVLPPMTLALLRFIIASLLLYFVLKIKEPDIKLEKKDMGLMALAGVFGVSLYFYFENNGIMLITASAASIIVAAVPMLTMISDAVLYKNPLNRVKIFSVIVSMAGVYLVVGSDISGSFKGFLMMFAASVSWVIYTVVTKPLFKRYSQLAIVYYQSIFGTITLLPFALFEKTNWSLVTPAIVLNVVYLGIFCSAVAYYYYTYMMDNLGINIASLFINFIPVVTVAGSYFILKENINLSQIIGGILVVAAVYMANLSEKDKKAEIKEAAVSVE